MNPLRRCRMCVILETRPFVETYDLERAAVREVAPLVTILDGVPRTEAPSGEMEPAQSVPQALRDATDGCPACILSAIRQSGRTDFGEWSYAKAKRALDL